MSSTEQASTQLAERTQQTAVTARPSTETATPPTLSQGVQGVILDTREYDSLWRMAEAYSMSQFVPPALKDDTASCFVLLQLAAQLDMPALPMMQRCYVVHGKPGMETPLALALFAKRTSREIRWRFSEDRQSCTAYAVDAQGQEVEGVEMTVTTEMAKRANWKSDGWKSTPELMLRYRSAMWLIRAYYPGVLFGISSVDEIRDTGYERPESAGQTVGRLLGDKPEEPKPVEASPSPERIDYAARIAEAQSREALESLYRQAKEDPAVKPAKLRTLAAQCKNRVTAIQTTALQSVRARIDVAASSEELAQIGEEIDLDGHFSDEQIADLAERLMQREAAIRETQEATR